MGIAATTVKPVLHRSERLLADRVEDINTNRDENPIPYVDAVVDNVSDKADGVAYVVNDPYLSPAIDGTTNVVEELVDIIQDIRRKENLEEPIDLSNVPDAVIEESIQEIEEKIYKEYQIEKENQPVKVIDEKIGGTIDPFPNGGDKTSNKNDNNSVEKENNNWIKDIIDNDYFIPATASVGGLLFILFAVLIKNKMWGSDVSSNNRKGKRPNRINNIGRNHSNSSNSDGDSSPQSYSSSRTYDEESDISVLSSPSNRDEVIEQPLSGRLVSNSRNQKQMNSPTNFETLSTDAVHNGSPSDLQDLEDIPEIHNNGTPKMSITDIYSPKQLMTTKYNSFFTKK